MTSVMLSISVHWIACGKKKRERESGKNDEKKKCYELTSTLGKIAENSCNKNLIEQVFIVVDHLN